MQHRLAALRDRWLWQWRTKPLDALTPADRGAEFVPWFLQCNDRRFPYWFGAADPRNQRLVDALQSFTAHIVAPPSGAQLLGPLGLTVGLLLMLSACVCSGYRRGVLAVDDQGESDELNPLSRGCDPSEM